jgi:hypothetical protein
MQSKGRLSSEPGRITTARQVSTPGRLKTAYVEGRSAR